MRIYFDEKTHQYFTEEHEPYISVSALAKKVEKEKDWAAILKKKAKKDGVTVKQLRALWEKKRVLGTEAGTKVHKKSEDTRFSSPTGLIDSQECLIKHVTYSGGYKWSEPSLKLETNCIYPEKMIFNHKYKICGQADEVWTPNKVISVFDIKTDKEISRKGFSTDWMPAERFKPPVSHLENCNFNMYSLKMSMYLYMLWLENKDFKIGDLILEWQPLLRDKEGIPILDQSGEPTILKKERIQIPYLRNEVKDIFEWYKAGKFK